METKKKREIINTIKKDPSLPSKEKIEEWVQEIQDSVSELPHYLENKTFNILSNEIEKVLIKNDIPLQNITEKLDGYRYVDEIHELFRGKHIRWIRLNNKVPLLTNGGIVMDIKFLDEGIQILCRNGTNRFIQYKFDECLTFQKLTDEEWLLLSIKSKI
jgi:hypothetical protein